MSEKSSSFPLEAALELVNPERRKLLGMLLAGAAALPMLSTTALAADDKPAAQQKHSPQVKNSSAPIKSTPQVKNSGAPVKSTTQVKSSSAPVKGSTQVKGSSAPK